MEDYAATASQAQPCIAPHEEDCLAEVISKILRSTYNNIGTVDILLHELGGVNPSPAPDLRPANIKMHIEMTRQLNEMLTDRLNDLKQLLIG